MRDLDALVEPTTRGDPMSPLRWTCKSTYWLAEELKQQGHSVSQQAKRNMSLLSELALPSRTNGPSSTRPVVRFGASAAAQHAAAAPIKLPMRIAGPPKCSASAMRSLPAATSSS